MAQPPRIRPDPDQPERVPKSAKAELDDTRWAIREDVARAFAPLADTMLRGDPTAPAALVNYCVEVMYSNAKHLLLHVREYGDVQDLTERMRHGQARLLADLRVNTRQCPMPLRNWIKRTTRLALHAARQHINAEAIRWVRAVRKELAEGAEPAQRKYNPSLTWDAIQISLISDERVQLTIGDARETLNYTELGFGDQRTGAPRRAWTVFQALAESAGKISMPIQCRPKIEKRVQEIRRMLGKHFGISTDPIPFERGIGYRARFRITSSPSARF